MHSLPDVDKMKAKAESECNLLQFYQISFPLVVHVSRKDTTSMNSQWTYFGTTVRGCSTSMFRLMSQVTETAYSMDAISVALYGEESAHVLLRLLASIEVLLYSTYVHSKFILRDVSSRLVLSNYTSYCDVHTVLAVSSVIQKLIQSRSPLLVQETSGSPSKLVVGRDVHAENPVRIMDYWLCKIPCREQFKN